MPVDRRNAFALRRIKRPKTLRCGWCNTKIKVKGRGRVPEFCCPTHRQRAYEKRKHQRPIEVELLARDIATARVRRVIRAEVWALLKQVGLVAEPEPPPLNSPRQPHRPAYLRVVKEDEEPVAEDPV